MADWWTDLYDGKHADTGSTVTVVRADEFDDNELLDDEDAFEEFDDGELLDDEESGDKPRRVRPLKDYVVGAHTDFARRRRNLLYSGSAAALGWGLGLEGRCHDLIAECGTSTGSPLAAVILGGGLVAVAIALIDRRTRHWYLPLAWACRIPAASAVVALALYSPAVVTL
jgi:hypothetical protein